MFKCVVQVNDHMLWNARRIELLKKTWKMLLLFLLRQNPFGEGTRAKMQFYGFSKPRMKRLQENQCVASQIFHTLLSEAAKDVLKVQQVWSYKLLLRAWKRREESHKRKSLPSSTVISKIRIILGAYRNLTLLLVEFTYGRYPVFVRFGFRIELKWPNFIVTSSSYWTIL